MGILAVVGLVIVAPAYAVSLSPTPAPLPGGTFQAADGNQAAPSALTDWAPENAADRVTHAPDPNAQDSAFTGGSKEDAPGRWDLTTEAGGVNPAKANIRDAWGTLQQPANRTFLNLAFARETAQGTTFLTFELNRDARLWDNGRARIPCRTTGDLLVSYEPQGNSVEVMVERWVTTRADPESGCAAEGRLEDANDVTPNVDVQGALNAAAIANSLPGAYGSSIPEERFGEAGLDLAAVLADGFSDRCFAYTSVWTHSRSSNSDSANMQDYVAPELLEARRCAAAGTKFFDRNANGVRNAGEPGLPRFVIFADYDGDGMRDADEPFAVTDDAGRYVIDDIRPPSGSYTLRETFLPGRRVARRWRCSFPAAVAPGPLGCGHGPIDVATEPYARGRDFGNWYPARLRVLKRLYPASDPGRFDLLVNGGVIVPAAGDGAARTIAVAPGTYGVAERAVAPTDPGAYRSTVECKLGTRRTVRRSGTTSSIALLAGDTGVCTFRNARLSAPVIVIDKTGPAMAEAGTTLRYRLFVENIGAVPIASANVDVVDEACDSPPELDDKRGDTSPGALDPGDVWIYSCSRATAAPGDECVARTVTNTGEVSGTANGSTVTDSSTISTVLTCPELPVEPGGEVAPPGPDVPRAGVAGKVASLRLPSCLRRGSRVIYLVSRVASLRLFVGGEQVGGVSVRPLGNRVVIRVRKDFAPGRYRVTARIRYQRGAGTPPVRITRTVRICGRPAPIACPAAAEARASCLGIRPRRLAR
jgi:archaellum component FlaG (FlaF/FlaG flagellin family)